MTNEILIGVCGLVLSVLTYFAGVWRTERRHDKEDREARVRNVFDKYMECRRSNFTGGYDGLQKAGIATLASNQEVEELIRLVLAHGEEHPLGSNNETVFYGVDLLKFFRFAAEQRVNFHTRPVDEVLRDSGAKA